MIKEKKMPIMTAIEFHNMKESQRHRILALISMCFRGWLGSLPQRQCFQLRMADYGSQP